ncbi:DUF4255 domain-containing protein [Plesiocystis pacifica]|uniref:DUF4255 domain-containing protein n=1 Tax=Plesiocystis pacifica TaxID=191768 RepID=UPI0012FC4237|nr:DUF4255 domain-containing protein [Plesiocystis pacifica]
MLSFLRRQLDSELKAGSEDEAASDKVVFVDGDKMDPLQFKLGAVTLMLINVEEERVLRPADRYARRNPDGTVSRSFPDIRLSLNLFFVARFKLYDEAWQQLSQVIGHYQSKPVYDRTNTPGLPAGVEKLIFELRTLNFAEQNEIWNALRICHHPSVLYRTNLIVVEDKAVATPGVEAGEAQRKIGGSA